MVYVSVVDENSVSQVGKAAPAHSELESDISFGNIKQDLSLILQSLWPLDAGNVSH